MTEKTTSPWLRYVRPSLREMTLHRGGKMDETRTRFCEAIPASRRASSNEVKRSLCLPTPLVKNSFFGTMLFPNFYVSSVRFKIAACARRSRLSLSHSSGQKRDGARIHGTFTWMLQAMGAQRCGNPPANASFAGGFSSKILRHDRDFERQTGSNRR